MTVERFLHMNAFCTITKCHFFKVSSSGPKIPLSSRAANNLSEKMTP